MLNTFSLKSGLKNFTQLKPGFIPHCYLKILKKFTVTGKF